MGDDARFDRLETKIDKLIDQATAVQVDVGKLSNLKEEVSKLEARVMDLETYKSRFIGIIIGVSGVISLLFTLIKEMA